MTTEQVNFAGGCLWGVQEYVRYLKGVISTEAGRANGTSNSTQGEYDGYVECVRTLFDSQRVSLEQLLDYFFEIIDPYSINKQGEDVGRKYRAGFYSLDEAHLASAKKYIGARADASQIVVEVLPLSNYVRSDDEHQDRLTLNPEDKCHIPKEILFKYRT